VVESRDCNYVQHWLFRKVQELEKGGIRPGIVLSHPGHGLEVGREEAAGVRVGPPPTQNQHIRSPHGAEALVDLGVGAPAQHRGPRQETYLALAREDDWDGQRVPAYVERAFRQYLEPLAKLAAPTGD